MNNQRRSAPPGVRPGGPPGGPPGRPGGGPPGMRMPAEKAKNFKASFARLMKILKPFRLKIFVVFIITILATLFSVLSPMVYGGVINLIQEGVTPGADGVVTGVDFTGLLRMLMLLTGLYLASAGFNFIQQFVMVGVSQRLVYNMRADVDRKLSRLPLKYYDDTAHGDTLSRVTNDIDTVSTTLQQNVTQIISSVISVVGFIIMMFIINIPLTLAVIGTVPVYMIVTMIVAPRSMKHFVGQQKYLGELNGRVEETYSGYLVVKAFGREKESVEEFARVNDKLYESAWKAHFISGIIMPLMNMVGNIGYIVICVVGGTFVASGTLDLGAVSAFMQYVRQFTHPINQIATIANTIQSTIAAAERVFEILDAKEEEPDPVLPSSIASPEGRVELRGVDFGYSPEKILIKGMNVSVEPGRMVAIVGPTGAGKTTIVNLLMRFYEVDAGGIYIDGVHTGDMTRADVRGLFGMVLQDTWLFNGTIRDNIAYGRENAAEGDVISAARAAHADWFIRTLPMGYDTVLAEDAGNISQGQRQLLTIARAILADPKILILDEATSSVDTRTEMLIQNAMAALMKGRTSFVIAHRLSTIRDADLILVMNEGSIIETGNHEELMAQNGFYADLYNSQFTAKAQG